MSDSEDEGADMSSVSAASDTEGAERGGGDSRQGTLRWSAIRPTPGCFFFSGPGELGRDDSLGTDVQLSFLEGRAALLFSPETRFLGPADESGIVVRRISHHEHGRKWEVSETFAFHQEGERLIGAYRYNECQVEFPPQCPGRCIIDASVEILLR